MRWLCRPPGWWVGLDDLFGEDHVAEVFQGILLPDYPAISYPGLALSFIAEAGLGLWLLVRGIKDPSSTPGKDLTAAELVD